MNDDGFTTPEGFVLARPLLLPDARTFAEVLTYEREWYHATMSHYAGVVARPELVPRPRMIGRNELGPFCTVKTTRDGRRSIAVTATDAVRDVIRPRIVTDDDHLSFKVIEHAESGRALVIAEHGYIIGSHWLAYIDPATIPVARTEVVTS